MKDKSEAFFEFEKLKFEINFYTKNLINEFSRFDGFHHHMVQIETIKIPEWKERAKRIQEALN